MLRASNLWSLPWLTFLLKSPPVPIVPMFSLKAGMNLWSIIVRGVRSWKRRPFKRKCFVNVFAALFLVFLMYSNDDESDNMEKLVVHFILLLVYSEDFFGFLFSDYFNSHLPHYFLSLEIDAACLMPRLWLLTEHKLRTAWIPCIHVRWVAL